MKNRLLIALAALLAFTIVTAPAASATSVIGSSKASANPWSKQGHYDPNVRLEQTYYRTVDSGRYGKVLAYKATPSFEIVRWGPLPNIKYVFRYIESNYGNTSRNPGQFGSMGAPAANVNTYTIAVWDVYIGGQWYETLRARINTSSFS